MSVITDLFRNKAIRLFIIACGLGILSAFLAVAYLKAREEALQQQYLSQQANVIPVVVASSDMQAGDIINNGNMSIRQIPAEFVMSDIIVPDDFHLAEGRNLLQPVSNGKPVPWAFVAGEGYRDFSDSIRPGRRALTVQVDEVNSVSGLIRPGNSIDIFASIDSELVDEKSGEAVFPVLENVSVLATGQTANSEPGTVGGADYTTLTIDVSPRDAAMLATAQETGKIIALLRNPEDQGRADFNFIQSSDLYRLSAAANSDILLDSNGKPLGRVVTKLVDGKLVKVLVDKDGNEIGQMKNGELISEVVRDADGNILGTVVNGQVVDKDGNVIGNVVDGEVIGLDGNKLANAVIETIRFKPGAEPESTVVYVDFIVGGTSKDGVAEVQKVVVQ